MVTQDSAMKSVPNEWIQNGIAINADHSNMVKFSGDDDPHYEDVRSMFQAMVEKAREFPPEAETPIHFMVPYPKNEYYIGTSQTAEHFIKNPIGKGVHRRFTLWGLGGVG